MEPDTAIDRWLIAVYVYLMNPGAVMQSPCLQKGMCQTSATTE